ncbi:type IV toxin-antitoxin system AbiEi family antitoxin domain-containing protein [Kribbella sp. NPDC051718]|uniref:type IV toxin-antitoxin system AbiEi family antitoxin domain-containing protein n=1 Tax=Kribbella sp. NPDC051718 TaxID=3155168 RepID=UPI003435CC78
MENDQEGQAPAALMGRGDESVRLFVELRQRQKGAFSRAQALEYGITDKVLQRRCRVRQLQRVHHGVYVDFTGPLPWETRMWAAWLACGPDAALTGKTALRYYGLEGDWDDADPIHLVVPHARRLDRRAGIVVTRWRELDSRLHPTRRPPTVRVEVALLTTASRERAAARQAAMLLDACRQRRTTPQRLLAELATLGQLRGREVIQQILLDAADGVQSFLEHCYLLRVERAHGLPVADRQVRAVATAGSAAANDSTTAGPRTAARDKPSKRVVYRDVEYSPYDVIVELDGRLGHSDALSRWRDMSRDNAAATSGKLTLRFGYQLVSHPCETAAQVVTALQHRGWTGAPHPCSPTCALGGILSGSGEANTPIRGQYPPHPRRQPFPAS